MKTQKKVLLTIAAVAGSFGIASGQNTLYGTNAGGSLTTGNFNTMIGEYAGFNATTANNNSILGHYVGYSLTSGSDNTMSGYLAGYNTNTGSNNFFGGSNAGYNNTSGYDNTYIGHNSGLNNNGGANIFIGNQSGNTGTGQWANTFVGFVSGYSNQGGANCFFGYGAGVTNTTGDFNTFMGTKVGNGNTTGQWNCFYGPYSGNVNQTGSQNTAIGAQADFGGNALQDAAAFGYGCVTANSYEQRFGDGNVLQWGFGTDPAAGNALEVGTNAGNGNAAYLTATGVWTNTSDRNKKENIVEVDGTEILAKIDQLPLSRWNYKGDRADIQHIGPMAQDFYGIFHVGNNNTSISTIDPAGVALAGVKELHKQNIELQKQNEELSQKYNVLLSEIQQLKQMQAMCCNNNTQGNYTTNTLNGQAKLEQNAPNPFGQSTVIKYYLPANTVSAAINVKAIDGAVLQTIQVSGEGNGQIILSAGTLSSGTYVYDLVIDGRQIDSKIMIVARQ
jgi:hypothetical protein